MGIGTAITIALWPVIVLNLIVAGFNMSGKAPWLDWPAKAFIGSMILINLSVFGLVLSILLTING